jgi:hypothetical protein
LQDTTPRYKPREVFLTNPDYFKTPTEKNVLYILNEMAKQQGKITID